MEVLGKFLLDEYDITNDTIQIVIASLVEAKVNEEMIVKLLQKYCRLDENAAFECLYYEKNVLSVLRNFERYLRSNYDLERNEMREYIFLARRVVAKKDDKKYKMEELFDAVDKLIKK